MGRVVGRGILLVVLLMGFVVRMGFVGMSVGRGGEFPISDV
jgi:hypothetical protein